MKVKINFIHWRKDGLNNFKGLKNLTLKRKDGINALIIAVAMAATVPGSLFAHSAPDVTRIDSEIGDTAESPTEHKETTSDNVKSKKTSEKSLSNAKLEGAYQLNSLGNLDSLSTGLNSIMDSVSDQFNKTKLIASVAEQKATQSEEQQAEEKKKDTNDSDKSDNTSSVYLAGEVVYKPDTHYVHRKDCKWADSSCYTITSTDSLEKFICDIESMRTGQTATNVTYNICSECNPLAVTDSTEQVDKQQVAESNGDSSTINTSVKLDYYTQSVGDVYDGSPLPKASVPYDYEGAASAAGISDYDILLLRRIVSSEYGSDWVPVEEKAKIVAGVMNMMKSPDSWYPDNIEDILAKTCEPWGFNRYKDYYMSDSIIMAVDYYFAHPDEFGNYKSWWGDGTWNHFHNFD